MIKMKKNEKKILHLYPNDLLSKHTIKIKKYDEEGKYFFLRSDEGCKIRFDKLKVLDFTIEELEKILLDFRKEKVKFEGNRIIQSEMDFDVRE